MPKHSASPTKSRSQPHSKHRVPRRPHARTACFGIIVAIFSASVWAYAGSAKPAGAWVPTTSLSTIFAPTDAPADSRAVQGPSAEYGIRFVPLVAGSVYGVRIFRGLGDTDNHRASLWDSSGNRLAHVVLDGPATVGWQYNRFKTPVSLVAGRTYVISYHARSSHVEAAKAFLNGIVRGPLMAPQDTSVAPNGVIAEGPDSVFPRHAASGANYYADVLFQPASQPSPSGSATGDVGSQSTAASTPATTVAPSSVPASTSAPVTTAPSAPTTHPTSIPSTSSTDLGRAGAALFEPPNGSAYLGVSTDFSRLDTFDATAGIGTPAIYNRWTAPDGPFQPTLDQAATRPGLTPMISWNLPFDGGQVTDGSQDAYIAAQAQSVRTYGKPVFIRLDWEMNAYWYPHWNLAAVTPTQYVASWRHVYSLFKGAGVTNAAFVWAPNVLDYFSSTGQRVTTDNWYPGDDVVNWVGLDAYPQSAQPNVLLNGQDGMNAIDSLASAHGKPLMLAEWAPNTPHPDTADPINLVFDWAESHANVKALVYFDFITQGKDFTLVDHPVGAATFRSRVQRNSRYLLAGSVN